jgi:chlorophyll(ide) b reductase
VDTNVYGTLICTRAAVTLMRAQAGGGHVFNMKGAGSDGNATKKYAAQSPL